MQLNEDALINAYSPISTTLLGNVIEVKLEQFSKVLDLIQVTELGILINSRDIILLNAYSPISVTPSGNKIEIIFI